MNWKNDFKPEWITGGLTSEAIKFTDDFGKYLQTKRLSSSQLRNVFGEMKQIQLQKKADKADEQKLFTRYLLLYPKIAYAAGRQRSEALTTFKEVFEKAYRTIKNEEEFKKNYQNLVDFVESTLAFHRSYGGR